MWLRALASLVIGTIFACGAEPAADRTADIIRLHLAAIGGQDRIDALQSYRAAGRMGGDMPVVRFTTVAARPTRLRMEFQYEDRTEILACDGEAPPWKTVIKSGKPQEPTPMPEAEAAAFAADAIFDDPLVAGGKLGHTIAYAGDTKLNERTLLRVRVTVAADRYFLLMIDPETHLIAARIDPPDPKSGINGSIVTRYGDFRPVSGVLVAHEITIHVGGKPIRWAKIERIEPNPVLPPDIFSSPAPP